jgi:hypothetical protein
MAGQLTRSELARLYKTMDMAVRLARASGEEVVKKWNIAISYSESESQSAQKLTIEEQGREGFVLSMEWNVQGDMTVHVYLPGEWEAPLLDDAPALLF